MVEAAEPTAAKRVRGEASISTDQWIEALSIIGDSHQLSAVIYDSIISPVDDVLSANPGKKEIAQEMNLYLRHELESYRKEGKFSFSPKP